MLVGFGRVGRVVGEGLHAAGSRLVVIEDSDHSVAAARAAGIEVVVGNAASAEVLKLANLPAAQCLMIAIPNGFEAGTVCEVGRKLSPSLRIIARAHSEEEEAHLRQFGADTVIMGEREIGLGMLAWLRGDRADDKAPEANPLEPKLPPSDNLLEMAAVAPAAAAAMADEVRSDVAAAAEARAEAAAEAAPVAELPVAASESPAEAAAELEAQEADEINEGGPAPAAEPVATDAAPVEPVADPAVIAVVEATPEDAVIILPPPEPQGQLPAATLETVATTPSVGEAPAAIDEVIAPVPASEPAEAPNETPIEADAELARQENDETNEGGPAPADAEGPAPAGEPVEGDGVRAKNDEDKPAEGGVPPVLPEPKS